MRRSILSFIAVAVIILSTTTTASDVPRPKVRHLAPEFSATALVPGGKFAKVSNQDYPNKWLVLFFYPLDFTFVCPTEIIEFSREHERFAAVGAQILGVSVDSHFSHLAWSKLPIKEGGIGPIAFPLLSDIDKNISRSYDVLVTEGEDAGVALRGTFIIDPKGIIRHAAVNDLPVGRSVSEVLRLLQAFQFSDANGNVCPSTWTPGEQGITPTPEEARSFFSSFG